MLGCVETSDHKVMIRRDPDVVAEQRRYDSLTYFEFLAEREDAFEATRLSVELERRGAEREVTLKQLRAVMRTVPTDPWVDYELERHDVMYREWADARGPLPGVDFDQDGPPGYDALKRRQRRQQLQGPIQSSEDY